MKDYLSFLMPGAWKSISEVRVGQRACMRGLDIADKWGGAVVMVVQGFQKSVHIQLEREGLRNRSLL
jgi:hypothetical protein